MKDMEKWMVAERGGARGGVRADPKITAAIIISEGLGQVGPVPSATY